MSDGIESRIATKTGIDFTVNNAVNEAGLILTGTPDLSGNVGVQYFSAGDNVIIKGFCLSLPYQFGQGSMANPARFQLGWVDSAAGSGSVSEVGDTGLINIPDFNYWYEMNVYVPYPSPNNVKWGFRIVGLIGNVSMIYSPVSLNTEELNAQIHLRVQHTSPMLA